MEEKNVNSEYFRSEFNKRTLIKIETLLDSLDPYTEYEAKDYKTILRKIYQAVNSKNESSQDNGAFVDLIVKMIKESYTEKWIMFVLPLRMTKNSWPSIQHDWNQELKKDENT